MIHNKDENGWQSVDQIGNVKFYQSAPSIDDLPNKSLVILSEKEVSSPNLDPLYVIRDLRGDILFEAYEKNEKQN